jgi:hypothetical protein
MHPAAGALVAGTRDRKPDPCIMRIVLIKPIREINA